MIQKIKVKPLRNGQALVEVLVAMTVGVLVLTAITSSVLTSLVNSRVSSASTAATQYAQEANEIARVSRNAPAGTYCLDKGITRLSGSPQGSCTTPNVDNKFIRTVQVLGNEAGNDCGTGVNKTIVTVSWTDAKCASGTYCHSTRVSSCASVLALAGTITPTPPPPGSPTVTLNASPLSVNPGQSSTLSWSSTNSVSCTWTAGLSGTVSASGSTNVSPTTNITYTLYCTSSLGVNSSSASKTITVIQPTPTPTNTPTPTPTKTPTPTPTKTPTPTPTPVTTQLLSNTGFESVLSTSADTGTWKWYDTFSVDPRCSTASCGYSPRTGTWYLYLGGRIDTVQTTYVQQGGFTIPSNATAATLSFYLRIISDDSSGVAHDILYIQVLDGSNTVLGTPVRYSNADQNASYALKTVSINSATYKGIPIKIRLRSDLDATGYTSFLIDDVTLTETY